MDLEHERRLTEVESRSKSNMKRLDDVEQRQSNLEVLADREERLENDVGEIKSDVKEIKGKPGKRWEALVSDIIKIVVAAVCGFFLAKFGM